MQEYASEITSIAYGGAGVTRLPDGRVCFLRGTVQGERVRFHITREKRSYAEGEVLEVLQRSPERISPQCPHYPECPGCVYLHMNYGEELRCKQRQFTDFLLRNRLTEAEKILPPFGSPQRFGWRNKLKFAVENGRCGYRGWDNVTLIPTGECLLGCPEINRALHTPPPFAEGTRTLRYTKADGVVDSAFDDTDAMLTETVAGAGEFEVRLGSFFQTNPAVAAELVRRVIRSMEEKQCRELLELYCGVGVFSLAAAEKNPFLHTIGVERDPEAIKCAARNAERRELSERCRFYAADAERYRLPDRFDTVLIDPPRSGVSSRLLEKLAARRPGRLLYISCAADTLTRDLKLLADRGAEVRTAGILDMFPGTAHFESLTELTFR